MYNKVILIGEIISELNTSKTDNNNTYLSFTLKTFDSEYKNQLHTIVFWNSLADIAIHKLKKGINIMVEGKIRSHNKKYEIVGKVFNLM